MKKNYTTSSIQELPKRRFTFKQLSKISDDNYGVLNRCIDMSFFNENDMFLLEPVIIHYYAYFKPVSPHFRTWVISLNDTTKRGFQDLTFEQWEEGEEVEEVQKETIKFSEKVRRDFRKKELIKKSA